jgi:hypothetical protein
VSDENRADPNAGRPWAEMDLFDFANCVRLKQGIEEIADFPCRLVSEVHDKIVELERSGELERCVAETEKGPGIKLTRTHHHLDRSGVDQSEMADSPVKTYCPVCERPIKTNARGLLHRHKARTDRHTEAELCPGSGQPPVDEAIIITAGNQRRRQALRQMTRDRRL